MSLIGNGANLIIDYELNKYKREAYDPGRGELITAQKLLNKVVSAHNGLIDVVAYDGLACNALFMNECRKLDVEAVVRIKKSRVFSIKKVKRNTNKKNYTRKWYDGYIRIKAYESLLIMDGVKHPLMYVKFAKKNKKR